MVSEIGYCNEGERLASVAKDLVVDGEMHSKGNVTGLEELKDLLNR